MSIRLLLIFFVSGISGLVYQVLWTRLFGNMFGNTIVSASLVTAVFMLGLGLGGWLVGGLCDRAYRKDAGVLLRYYGYAEIMIGLLAFLLAYTLPNMAGLAAVISHYQQGENGWFQLDSPSIVLRYCLAALMLLPVTVLMGATLTLLVRHVVQTDVASAGGKIGALYAVNTAGAAMGAGVVDFALVPFFGLFAAQSIAVVLNLAAGLGALLLARSATGRIPAIEIRPTEPAPAGGVLTQRLYFVAMAIFLSGFVGMAMEIIWYRFFISAMGATRGIFSLLLCVMLIGFWLGSFLSGQLHRRWRRGSEFYIASQCLFLCVALYQLVQFQKPVVDLGDMQAILNADGAWAIKAAEAWYLLKIIAPVVGVPAVFMGFAYPMANAIAQDELCRVGSRAGAIYFANMLGAVLGSLAAGFVLLPWLGMKLSITALIPATLLSVVLLVLASRNAAGSLNWYASRSYPRGALRTGALAAVLIVVAGLVWRGYPAEYLVLKTYRPYGGGQETVIATSEGSTESIVVTEEVETGSRSLYTNSHNMSDNGFGGQRYMRAFSHIPLLQIDEPESVLVICFGVGNTLHAASLHDSVKSLEIVDTSRHVLSHAPYFEKTNGGVLQDPRVNVFINDGRLHLRMQSSQSYDLVTLEPPPIAFAGVSALYSREFYELVYDKLKPGGFLTQWVPSSQVSGDSVNAMVRAFVEVFPNTVLLSGSSDNLVLMGRRGEAPFLDPEIVGRRLAGSPALRADMESVSLGRVLDIAGAFAGSAQTLNRAVQHTLPVTDNYPVMEYDVLFFNESRKSVALFDVRGADQWCPACFTNPQANDTADLPLYLTLMQQLYQSEGFLYSGRRTWPEQKQLDIALSESEFDRLLAGSKYLRVMFRGDSAKTLGSKRSANGP